MLLQEVALEHRSDGNHGWYSGCSPQFSEHFEVIRLFGELFMLENPIPSTKCLPVVEKMAVVAPKLSCCINKCETTAAHLARSPANLRDLIGQCEVIIPATITLRHLNLLFDRLDASCHVDVMAKISNTNLRNINYGVEFMIFDTSGVKSTEDLGKLSIFYFELRAGL